ncbi:MAG: carbamoyltransferase [bacterium]
MNILGISAFYHDSAACLLQDGRIIAAAQEERFTRKKHDYRFPINAVNYCLKEGRLRVEELDYVGFYDKPFIKFERILLSYFAYAPFGLNSFLKALPIWLKQKIFLREVISKELGYSAKIIFPEHHESHAASAFYPSPFEEAAFITTDGVGEWTTTSYGIGKGNNIEIEAEQYFPHSLGLLYSAFTYYTGFKVNSGEYKLMGLAPYGEPKYVDTILNNLVDLKEDGSFRMNMRYFNYIAGLTMTNRHFSKLFEGPPRKAESKVSQKEMDIAASIQKVTKEIMLRITRYVQKKTGMKNLCLAGGVALNCVANGYILKDRKFERLWIQPAAGDAGGALGCALFIWYKYLQQERVVVKKDRDAQSGSYLGPSFFNSEIKDFLDSQSIPYKELTDEDLPEKIADLLAKENVLGWFHGRMEFGPRALGARSIIGDARSPNMQKTMNLRIKFRESFRPFAPSVLREHVSSYFELDDDSPYMLLVVPVNKKICIKMTREQSKLFGIDKLNIARSGIPAITHVDYSARVQTVHKDTNPRYYAVIEAFYKKTGCPVIINTSFNVRGEPIVCTPQEAYTCFMRTDMDYLVLENFLIDKKQRKPLSSDVDWKKEFELD